MNFIKKSCFLGILLFILLSCTSCWNYKEINDLSLTRGLSFDKVGDKYDMTAKVLIAVSDQQKNSSIRHFFVNEQGDTLYDAARNLILKDGKNLSFQHLQYLIISEHIAMEDISQVLDVLMRDAETREDMWIYIAKEPYTAKEVLRGITQRELVTYVEDATLNVKYIGKFYPIKMCDLVEAINQKGKDAVAPLIYLKDSNQGKSAYIKGSAVFLNKKMIGTLNEEESRTYNLIMGHSESNIIPLAYNDDQQESLVSIDVVKNATQIKPLFQDDSSITIDVHTTLDIVIAEVMNTEVDVTSKNGQELLLEHFETYLEKSISQLIRKVQHHYRSDIFGFGEMVKNVKPNFWRKIEHNWEDIFPEVAVNVQASVKILGSNIFKEVFLTNENLDEKDR